MKRIAVMTNGCPENRIDAALMRQGLVKNKWELVDDYKTAEVIIFNACALTQTNQEASITLIEKIKLTALPSAQLIVWGCLPKINRARLEEVFQGEFFGTDQTELLLKSLNADKKPEKATANSMIDATHPKLKIGEFAKQTLKDGVFNSLCLQTAKTYMNFRSKEINVYRKNTFCIKVSTGCLSSCSYCAVKNSRGNLVSKPVKSVLCEYYNGLKMGYKEFALLGTDVGSYGRDLGLDLCYLLQTMTKAEGEYNIRVRNINSKYLIDMAPSLIKTLEKGKVSYLCSPVQTGSNRILKMMNRNHSIEDYKKTIHLLKREFPKIHIRSQVMVGFPTETDEEFHATLRLLEELNFDFVECYIFNPRPNTEAEKIEGKIQYEIARERYQEVMFACFKNDIMSRFFNLSKNCSNKYIRQSQRVNRPRVRS